ncbi:MAG: methyltransferase domain-containing protein [Ferruginibacter sp.]
MSLVQNDLSELDFFSSDSVFDKLYPTHIQELAYRHWTPLEVAKKAADFLTQDGKVKILDIGSGVGKFCLAAAHYKPNSLYYGVEQRKSLVEHADAVKEKLGLSNVTFTQGNFTKVDFKQYDHFYFYNSFYENLYGTQKIDNSIEYSKELYNYYNIYLVRQLEKMPEGTKLVTFHSQEDDMPRGYHIIGADVENQLNYLVKI